MVSSYVYSDLSVMEGMSPDHLMYNVVLFKHWRKPYLHLKIKSALFQLKNVVDLL